MAVTVGPWKRNPNFSPITLRYPELFPDRRAWMRVIRSADGAGWENETKIEYATDLMVAQEALKEAFDVAAH